MSDRFALRASGLSVRYGNVVALDDVSLEIPKGCSVALLGPNGSGKSTLFAAAVRLTDPSAGSIALGSPRVAFVPQTLDLDPAFPVSVRDVVRIGRYGDLGWFGRFHDRDRELVARGIDELGIGHLSSRRFGSLSGGERQRTLLAQAVAQDASIMLLDEPFTGVDAPTGKAIGALMRRWHEEGCTVVVATHNLQSAARDYDYVVCLNRRLVAFGPPEVTCTEEILTETFAGRTIRVGETLIDVAHHHEDAG